MALIAIVYLALAGQVRTDDASSHVVARRSIDEWHEIISRLELRDPASRQFVPGLIDLMNDKNAPWISRRQAALTLGRMGPLAREAIPSLARRLEDVDGIAADPESSTQRWALAALALYGREARDVASQLIDLLQDEQSPVITRLGCLEALSQIGSAAPDGIAAIWRELERGLSPAASPDDQRSALGAAEALGMVGPDAATAVPILLRAAQAEVPEFRREAIRSLGRIGPSARDAQETLINALVSDDEPLIRDLAATSLGQIGPSGWPLVQLLLSADDPEVRARAATAVAEWKTIRESILLALEPLLGDGEATVQLTACRSWRRLTGRHDRVWPILVELLAHAERSIRRDASRELQAITQSDDVTDGELALLLESSFEFVRREGRRLQRLREERSR